MTEAFVFVNCLLSMTGAVEPSARATEGVIDAYPTTGIYDLILRVKTEDEVQLRKLIQKVIKIQGVAATMTTIVHTKEKPEQATS